MYMYYIHPWLNIIPQWPVTIIRPTNWKNVANTPKHVGSGCTTWWEETWNTSVSTLVHSIATKPIMTYTPPNPFKTPLATFTPMCANPRWTPEWVLPCAPIQLAPPWSWCTTILVTSVIFPNNNSYGQICRHTYIYIFCWPRFSSWFCSWFSVADGSVADGSVADGSVADIYIKKLKIHKQMRSM